MPGSVFEQTVACSFVQNSKEVRRNEEMEEGCMVWRDLGWGVLGRPEGWTTLLSSSHRLNIDILEWLFSKKACFTV